MSKVKKLNLAKKGKNDEFYTQLSDIENELKHYKKHFKNQVVFCNCDDPEWSNFWKYFEMNFIHLGLKKLIATHYQTEGSSYKLELTSQLDKDGCLVLDRKKAELTENGDFRTQECIGILKEADIVVTNPPFSLFREYVPQLIENDKKFIIIGNQNAITFKEIFPLIKSNRLWLGVHSNATLEFKVPEHYELTGSNCRTGEDGQKYVSVSGIQWFTNLDNQKRHEELILFRTYNEQDYPKYDNYNAIEVSKVSDIPVDYDGVMGVPITFLSKHNVNQFEILGATESEGVGFSNGLWDETSKVKQPLINGVRRYKRLFIRKRKED